MKSFKIYLMAVLAAGLMACNNAQEDGSNTKTASNNSPSAAVNTGSQLTAWQTEHGVGPVTENLTLGAVDAKMAERGVAVFDTKCSACHKIGERYVGPALGDVLSRRKPEYVMNMILDPEKMLKLHPEAQKMLAQFYTPMPNQNLTKDEARDVLEYLRQQQSN
ncbi:MAG: cytochrome c [Calditrichia bacterium]